MEQNWNVHGCYCFSSLPIHNQYKAKMIGALEASLLSITEGRPCRPWHSCALNGIVLHWLRRSPLPSGMAAKRGPTAYFLFSDEQREATRAECLAAAEPGAKISVAVVAKAIGKKWRALSDKAKAEYKARAAQQALDAASQAAEEAAVSAADDPVAGEMVPCERAVQSRPGVHAAVCKWMLSGMCRANIAVSCLGMPIEGASGECHLLDRTAALLSYTTVLLALNSVWGR